MLGLEVKLVNNNNSNNNNILYLRADPTPNRQLQNHYYTKHKQTKRTTVKVKNAIRFSYPINHTYNEKTLVVVAAGVGVVVVVVVF
jgi:hypothetical protein